jgi:Fe-S oxidoreductase
MDSFKKLGFNPVDLQTGCCGMAGSFGYSKDNFDVSMKIGEQVLFPGLKELPDDAIICSPGFSCRHQIADGPELKSYHPAEIVDRFLK